MRRVLWLGCLFVVLFVVPGASQDKPLPPREAPLRMTLPEGFRATLFAGEPDVVQPIAFAFDDRGRLWVVECLSYPHWIKEKEGKDRVLIFEDTDGDGQFNKRTVFYDKGANVSGIQVGFGGVWLCATPYLLFIPDKDGDDKPDGPPEVRLDGWSREAKHNVFNSLTWGPDGWLYGCNGITATSRIGKPGTPDKERVPLNCGVWRYHPTRQTFEVVAWGTTNPWGLDFDDHGEMFITNCVIAHLWHVVPGAHFQRMYGQDLNPNCYSLIASCADHLHWAGGHWTTSRGGQGAHGESGGGHAHAGAMVYLGDNWPDRYRNGVFTCNLHGSRVNHDLLERRGAGYVARHGRDFLLANDPWFRGLAIHGGPDGGVFVSDWTDTGECHNYDIAHTTSGRIYKVTYGKPKHEPKDLAKLADAELVALQLHKNDWQVRHARRLLQERAVAGKLQPKTHEALRTILNDNPDATRKLRALWALQVTGGLDEKTKLALLDHRQENVRAWAIRFVLEDRQPSAVFRETLAELAQQDPSPLVRLYLASGLQRLPMEQRWPMAERLVEHVEDQDDAYLPLMIWYGIEPLPPEDLERAAKLLARTKIPLVREYLARRIASWKDSPKSTEPPPGVSLLLKLLAEKDDPASARDVLRGLHEALSGRRTMRMPKGWNDAYGHLAESPLAEVRERSLILAVLFGDEGALTSLKKLVTDAKAPAPARINALQALVFRQEADLVPILQRLLADAAVRGAAIRGLAAFDHADTPKLLLKLYASLNDEEKADVVHTLTARPAYALALLDAVEREQIPRRDLTAFTVRQLLGMKHKEIDEKVTKVWGTIRPPSQEKAALKTKYKALLTADYLKSADRSNGRALYAKNCSACHRLFDDGGVIGPEITGSQRTNLDYLLDNLIDPSALVARDYQVTIVRTERGRTITGMIKEENERALTLQTQNEIVVVPKTEIDTRTASPLSMMPEGLLATLKEEEIRDLIAYLAGPGQAAMPKGGEKK